jgi:hypothetical protein
LFFSALVRLSVALDHIAVIAYMRVSTRTVDRALTDFVRCALRVHSRFSQVAASHTQTLSLSFATFLFASLLLFAVIVVRSSPARVSF